MGTMRNNPALKAARRIGLATALLLLVPLVAMRFTEEVDWSLFDFVVAGTLLFGAGMTYQLIAARFSTRRHRVAVGIVVTAALLLAWVHLAVGLFGNGPGS